MSIRIVQPVDGVLAPVRVAELNTGINEAVTTGNSGWIWFGNNRTYTTSSAYNTSNQWFYTAHHYSKEQLLTWPGMPETLSPCWMVYRVHNVSIDGNVLTPNVDYKILTSIANNNTTYEDHYLIARNYIRAMPSSSYYNTSVHWTVDYLIGVVYLRDDTDSVGGGASGTSSLSLKRNLDGIIPNYKYLPSDGDGVCEQIEGMDEWAKL